MKNLLHRFPSIKLLGVTLAGLLFSSLNAMADTTTASCEDYSSAETDYGQGVWTATYEIIGSSPTEIWISDPVFSQGFKDAQNNTQNNNLHYPLYINDAPPAQYEGTEGSLIRITQLGFSSTNGGKNFTLSAGNTPSDFSGWKLYTESMTGGDGITVNDAGPIFEAVAPLNQNPKIVTPNKRCVIYLNAFNHAGTSAAGIPNATSVTPKVAIFGDSIVHNFNSNLSQRNNWSKMLANAGWASETDAVIGATIGSGDNAIDILFGNNDTGVLANCLSATGKLPTVENPFQTGSMKCYDFGHSAEDNPVDSRVATNILNSKVSVSNDGLGSKVRGLISAAKASEANNGGKLKAIVIELGWNDANFQAFWSDAIQYYSPNDLSFQQEYTDRQNRLSTELAEIYDDVAHHSDVKCLYLVNVSDFPATGSAGSAKTLSQVISNWNSLIGYVAANNQDYPLFRMIDWNTLSHHHHIDIASLQDTVFSGPVAADYSDYLTNPLPASGYPQETWWNREPDDDWGNAQENVHPHIAGSFAMQTLIANTLQADLNNCTGNLP